MTHDFSRYTAPSLRTIFGWALVGSLWASSAQGADAADLAAAEALFAEGRELLSAGRFDEACPKFAESQRLDPGAGTALNLAECYEKQGRTATAWGIWLEAAALARQAGQADREQFAQERAKRAEENLHRLVIRVPEASRVPGLTVRRGDNEVRPGAWDTALPIDPGTHEIEASAPGKVSYRTTVDVDPGPGQSEVSIPELVDESVSHDVPQSGAVDGGSGSGRRTAGVVVGSIGAAGLLVGGVFGLRALSLNEDSKAYCSTDRYCDAQGVGLRNDALAAGNVATLFAGVGGALLATGVVIWLTAPSATAPQVGALSTGDGANLFVRGSF